jgi:uncharacterized protein (UPF0335 family)
MDKIEKLEREIKEQEKKMEKDHFGELFNKGQQKKNMNRLLKLRKELEELKGKVK